MRKTKPPCRSRLIRKWDGTPVDETDATAQPIPTDATDLTPGTPHSTTRDKELIFDIEREDELTDTFER